MDFPEVDFSTSKVLKKLRRKNLSTMLVRLNYQPHNQQVSFRKKNGQNFKKLDIFYGQFYFQNAMHSLLHKIDSHNWFFLSVKPLISNLAG